MQETYHIASAPSSCGPRDPLVDVPLVRIGRGETSLNRQRSLSYRRASVNRAVMLLCVHVELKLFETMVVYAGRPKITAELADRTGTDLDFVHRLARQLSHQTKTKLGPVNALHSPRIAAAMIASISSTDQGHSYVGRIHLSLVFGIGPHLDRGPLIIPSLIVTLWRLK